MRYNTTHERSLAAASALNVVFASIVRPDPLTWRSRPLKLQPDTLMLAEPRSGRTDEGRLRDQALLCHDDATSLSDVFKQCGFRVVKTSYIENLETHSLPASFMGQARIVNLRITNPMYGSYHVHIRGLVAEDMIKLGITERLHEAFGYKPLQLSA